MKICYLIDSVLNNGGAPISTHILAKEMASLHLDVFLIMPKEENDSEKDTLIKYCEINSFKNYFPFEFKQPISFLKLLRELDKEVNRIKPDIIHAQMPRGARAISILKKIGRIDKKIKLVYTDREYVVELKKIYKCLYRRTIASNYDKIICLSGGAVTFWNETISNQMIQIIPNPGGAIFDNYSEDDYKKALSSFPEIPKNKINIIFVGRMTWEKRWDMAKSVAFALNMKFKKRINIIFVISSKNDTMKKETAEYIKAFDGIENIIVYQNLSIEKLSQLYYVSDIHLITSSRESFGRTAIEAMSRRNVVISTEAGAIRETIGREESMVPDDIESIVEKVSVYLDDYDLRDSAKNLFFERYCERFNTKANTESHFELYSKLM